MVEIVNFSSATANYSDVNDVLERDGCVVIRDVLNARKAETLQHELEVHFEKSPVCQGNFFGFSTKRMSSVLAKSQVSRDLAVHTHILSVMDRFLLNSCKEYQLNLSQAIQICRGEPAQFIHTDDLMFPFELPVVGAQKMINCMWAVTDFTENNGATNLVPGSHKWPRDRRPEVQEIAQGVMPAGSLLVYFGSLLHGGGANKTSLPRTGLVLSYCLGWLRQAENHYLALPRELVRTFSPKLQRLVGYFVHEPNLGALEGRDPIEILQKDDLRGARFQEFIPEEFHEPLAEHRRLAMGQS